MGGPQIGPKIGPKSGPDFWKTGPERDLGPDAPGFSPNGAMAGHNSPNFIFAGAAHLDLEARLPFAGPGICGVGLRRTCSKEAEQNLEFGLFWPAMAPFGLKTGASGPKSRSGPVFQNPGPDFGPDFGFGGS